MVGFFNFVDGGNYGVSPFLLSQTELGELENGNVSNELGLITKEPGYFLAGTQITGRTTKKILGFTTYYDPATAITREYAVVNNAADTALELWTREVVLGVYTAWAEITAAESSWITENAKVEFETFINRTFTVAGIDNPSAVLNGTSFAVTGLAANMPNAKYIKRYRDRLYVAHCKKSGTLFPYRIYFSTIPQAGSITWEDVNFFDVDFGEEITGLESNFDRLLIFTRTKTYIYDQENLKLGWSVGCPDGRLIASDSVNTVWANSYGVWATVQGGQPQNIGGKVLPFLRNVFSSIGVVDFSSAMVDEEYWLVISSSATNIVKGKNYGPLALVFNFQTSSWRVRNFTEQIPYIYKFFDPYIDLERLIMGSNLGALWLHSKQGTELYAPTGDSRPLTSDAYVNAGSNRAISSSFTLPPFKLETYDVKMYIEKIVPYTENAGNLELTARILDNQSEALTPWFPLASLDSYQKEFSGRSIQGTLIQVKGSEVGKNTAWKFYGVEVELSKSSDLKD